MYATRDVGMLLFGLIWAACFVLEETQAWGYKNGILHNSIWLEQAAGVYHRESRKGRYQLTYLEAKAVCRFEGGKLATYDQLEAARQIGFHVCAAGWFDRGRVGYPIVKSGSNCGFGKVGIIDYGYRLNKSERWDVYCYNPTAKECGGVLTDQQRIIQSPRYPEEYEDEQICYWHIRVRYGQQIRLRFLEFDVEEDTGCLADYLEIYDSYDDISGFAGRFCGDELPEDLLSTGNVMTLKFLSDSSVTAGGFQLEYLAIDVPDPTTSEPFIPMPNPISEPLIAMTDPISEPLIPMTDPISEPLIPMTDPISEPFIPMTDSTSSNTSEPFSQLIDPTSSSNTSEPFSPMTDDYSNTSEPFGPMTDPTSSTNTSEPFNPMTDDYSNTSEPFGPMTDPTSSTNTSEPFSPMTDDYSNTSEPFSPMTDSTSSTNTSEPFSPMTDDYSNTSEPLGPMTDSTSSSNTFETFSPMADPTSTSNTSEPFSSLTDQ